MVFTSRGTSLLWSIDCGTILPSSSTASFSPVIASGTILDTSCAIKPSTVVLFSSAMKLNLAGFNCFNLVVASKSSVVVFRTFVVVQLSIQARLKSCPRVKVLVVRILLLPRSLPFLPCITLCLGIYESSVFFKKVNTLG